MGSAMACSARDALQCKACRGATDLVLPRGRLVDAGFPVTVWLARHVCNVCLGAGNPSVLDTIMQESVSRQMYSSGGERCQGHHGHKRDVDVLS